QDPRLVKTESPSLWASLSERQLFLVGLLTSPLGDGPALTAAIDVPDKHYFRNSYGGKDVIPLYRDAEATRPNVTTGLLDALGANYGVTVSVEQLAGYAYALLAHAGYTELFSDQLSDPGPRVPLTKDPEVFARGAELGQELLWLQTYGERFHD